MSLQHCSTLQRTQANWLTPQMCCAARALMGARVLNAGDTATRDLGASLFDRLPTKWPSIGVDFGSVRFDNFYCE